MERSRSGGGFSTFGLARRQALELRVEAAEALRAAIRGALEGTHGMLEPKQRKRLAYLLRSGVISI